MQNIVKQENQTTKGYTTTTSPGAQKWQKKPVEEMTQEELEERDTKMALKLSAKEMRQELKAEHKEIKQILKIEK